MKAKEELLEEIDTVFVPQKRVDFSYLMLVLLMIALACVFAFPKIYIQQQIYFKSRNIAKLQAEYETLKEENRQITASVEYIRFKNQILDTLF